MDTEIQRSKGIELKKIMTTEDLRHFLFQTILDDTQWYEALSQLCAYLGVPKALLSLRDHRTAQIVIPETVATTFQSPLMYGFDDAQVMAFLDRYAANDPWTAIERDQYPYYPYEMSRHLPKCDLQKTPFWGWLAPQGIDECVVCEIGRSDTYWVALNLYFGGAKPDKASGVIARLRKVLPDLRAAWDTGRQFRIEKASSQSFVMVLSVMPNPVVMIDYAGRIVATNTLYDDLLLGTTCATSVGAPVCLPSDMPMLNAAANESVSIRRGQPAALGMQATVSAFHSVELPGGERRNLTLISIAALHSQPAGSHGLIWDREALTDRERTLVRIVAQGHKFREAQAEMGVSYPRIMQLWKSARNKLDVRDVTDLRLAHKLSQS